jgi:hypothetical protein
MSLSRNGLVNVIIVGFESLIGENPLIPQEILVPQLGESLFASLCFRGLSSLIVDGL